MHQATVIRNTGSSHCWEKLTGKWRKKKLASSKVAISVALWSSDM